MILKLEIKDLAVLAAKLHKKDKSEIKSIFQGEVQWLLKSRKAKEGEFK